MNGRDGLERLDCTPTGPALPSVAHTQLRRRLRRPPEGCESELVISGRLIAMSSWAGPYCSTSVSFMVLQAQSLIIPTRFAQERRRSRWDRRDSGSDCAPGVEQQRDWADLPTLRCTRNQLRDARSASIGHGDHDG